MTNRPTPADVELTVSCYYEGEPVPMRTICRALSCSPDDVTRAAREGLIEIRRRLIRRGFSQLQQGVDSLVCVPAWATN